MLPLALVGLLAMTCANTTGRPPTAAHRPVNFEAESSPSKCPPMLGKNSEDENPELDGLLLSGPLPSLPDKMRAPGLELTVIAKVCIHGDGSIKDVTIVKGTDSTVNQCVRDAYMRRKYCAWHVRGPAVTFCHLVTTRFSIP